jgi:hypothetical protein
MTRSYLGYVSSQTTDTIFAGTYGTATGGTSSSITVGGESYTLLTFASDDNLVVSKSGLFDVLLVGGGGGAGGSDSTFASAGAGAGALVGLASTTTIYLPAGTVAVDIGAGGAGATTSFGGVGLASYIGSVISACGGGQGGSRNAASVTYWGGQGGSVVAMQLTVVVLTAVLMRHSATLAV